MPRIVSHAMEEYATRKWIQGTTPRHLADAETGGQGDVCLLPWSIFCGQLCLPLRVPSNLQPPASTILSLDLAKGPAREPQPYTGLGYHCHRSSLAIITHFCLRNINHPLAASQAHVRVIKGFPSLTPLFCLTVRIVLQGNTQEPTQQVSLTARLEWAGPEEPRLGRACSTACQCPL